MAELPPDTYEELGPKVNVLTQLVPWAGGLQFLLTVGPRFPGDARYVATNITFHKFDEHDQGVALEPTFKVSPEAAQTLMDELWRCGLRPSDGTGSAGQLGATEKHLSDMRALVAKYTETKLP